MIRTLKIRTEDPSFKGEIWDLLLNRDPVLNPKFTSESFIKTIKRTLKNPESEFKYNYTYQNQYMSQRLTSKFDLV